MQSLLPTFAHAHRPLGWRHHLQAALPLIAAAFGLVMLLTGVASASGGARATAQTPVGTGATGAASAAGTRGALGVLLTQQLPAGTHARPAVLRRPHRPAHIWVRPDIGYLSSTFGMRWGRLHAGIDLAGPYGSPIRAATDGIVIRVMEESGYGRIILIRDWDGTVTAYAHLAAFLVQSGHVHAGQYIALEGASGDATGPHLHFEVRVNGYPIDPLPFLRARGVYV